VGGQVIVATEGDAVYALNEASGRVTWHLQVGTPVSTSVIDQATGLNSGCGDINPLGITGTPVVDVGLDELFVADETMVGTTKWQNIRHDLIAISLKTHRELWKRDIDPPKGNEAGGYTIAAEQQRPALTYANGHIYVGFGGLAGDCGEYHGFEIGVATNNKGATEIYQVPSATEGAIWETNGAVVSSPGNLYVADGNGASTTKFDGSDAVIELSPTLKKLSVWAPSNWAELSASDWDLGSAGPIAIPGTTNLFVAGKPQDGSFGYLLAENKLGQGPGAPLFKGSVCSSTNAGDFGADATDVVTVGQSKETFIYAACGSGTEGLRYSGGPSPTFTQTWHATQGAMEPTNGVVKLSRTTAALNHFATPTVANGYLLIPTQTGVEAFTTSS
jgi:hypothetical protein